MLLSRIQGQATSTRRHHTIAGQRLLVGQALDADLQPFGDPQLTLDQLGDGPGDIESWINLGHAAWMLEDRARLRQAALRVLTMDSSRTDGHVLMAVSHRFAGKPERALRSLDKALTIEPDSATILTLRALVLQELGEHAVFERG